MRRALGILTILAVVAVTPAALAEVQNYKDTFNSGGYSGNDGTLAWSGPWKEVGESDGPGSGAVRVEGSGCSGSCLVIDTGLLSVAAGAYRLADTGDFADAKLSYKVAFDGGLLGLLNATLTVQASSNGGDSWSTVDSILLQTGSGGQTRTVDVTGFRDEHFGIRFTATGAAGAEVLIDDVRVSGELPPPSTTTTTSSTTTTTSSTTSSTTTTTTLLPPPTLPKLTTTTTSEDTTTTTRPTTTTTADSTGTTTADATTSTEVTTTTTTAAGGGGGDGGPGDGSSGSGDSGGDGLRQMPVGLASNFQPSLFESTPEVLAFEIDAGFANAVELVEASWYWVLGLALLIAAALIKGIDARVGAAKQPR